MACTGFVTGPCLPSQLHLCPLPTTAHGFQPCQPLQRFHLNRLCSFFPLYLHPSCFFCPQQAEKNMFVLSTYNGHWDCLAIIYFVSFNSYPHFLKNIHTFLVLWFELGSTLANQHNFTPRVQFLFQMTHQRQCERCKLWCM